MVAACTYTGPTDIATGNFVLAGSSLAQASVVTVSGGLIQFDNSASAGPVTATGFGIVGCEGGGTDQIGNITDLTMQSGSTLQMAVYTASNYGQLNASGTVSLGGATLSLGWIYTSVTGDAFTIISNTGGGAVAGTFAGLPEGATFVQNGRTYQITYVGGTGNDVVVTDLGAGGPTPTLTRTRGRPRRRRSDADADAPARTGIPGDDRPFRQASSRCSGWLSRLQRCTRCGEAARGEASSQEGVSMRASRRSLAARRLLSIAAFSLVALTATGRGADADSVTGSFTAVGKTYKLAHVYARRQPSMTDKSQTVVVILVTDNEVPKSIIDDKYRLELTDLARAGKVHGVSVTLGPDGKPSGTGFTYAKEFDGAIVNRADQHKAQVKIDATRAEGDLSGNGTFGSDKWEYTATFKATLATMK